MGLQISPPPAVATTTTTRLPLPLLLEGGPEAEVADGEGEAGGNPLAQSGQFFNMAFHSPVRR